MAGGKPAPAVCQTCRARHLQCDKTEPTCRRCIESGRTCVPAFNVRFRRRRNSVAADAGLHIKGSLAFQDKQEWVKTPKTLSFVLEPQTPISASKHRPKSKSASSVDAVDSFDAAQAPSLSDRSSPTSAIPEVDESVSAEPSYVVAPNTGISPSQEVSPGVRIEDLLSDLGGFGSPVSLHSNLSVSPLYVEAGDVGLIDGRSAALLHYFKTAIGRPWFDVTDPDFTNEALQLAPRCPVLLYSMLAIASMHKSRLSDGLAAAQLASEAETFHERCVSLLLPMLRDQISIMDGAFLACSTLLRFYEELSAPVHGRDDARHLLGGYASVAACQAQPDCSWIGISKSALFIHQRQDVYNAYMNQRVPKTNLDRCGIDRSNSPADAWTWAKRATCLHAEVVGFCRGSELGSVQSYRELIGKLDDWDVHRPAVFDPVFYRERDPLESRCFPELCFLLDCCAFALPYIYFSRILLAVYDPTCPRIGPAYTEGQRATKETVMYYLRLLCGLACSNPVPPARVISCLAVSQCSAWVTDPVEQDAMLGVLEMVEREDLWPTSTTQENLRAQWGKQN